MTPAAPLLSLLGDYADYNGRIVLGFSGGLDSSVLLEALVRAGLGARVTAVHVNHGIATDAGAWARHCRHVAERHGLAFRVEEISVSPGGNLEARAREARYEAYRRHLTRGDKLWLAHHRSDQAETLLLRLMRGAGSRGLAGMAGRSTTHAGIEVVRPLLGLSRDELKDIAHQWDLSWIDDPSNLDTTFDRNFVRLEVMPLLQQRWPGAAERVAVTADRLREDALLLDELACLDLDHCNVAEDRLDLAPFRELSAHRQRNLLRGWLGRRGFSPPDARVLQRVVDEVITARPDAEPRVDWPAGVFMRYADRLWLLEQEALLPWSGEATWTPGRTTNLNLGVLRIEIAAEGEPADLVLPVDRGDFVMRPKTGGERLLLRGHHRKVKEAWRVAGVPPWRRGQLPLFWHNDELVAVPYFGVADNWQPDEGEPTLRLRIRPSRDAT